MMPEPSQPKSPAKSVKICYTQPTPFLGPKTRLSIDKTMVALYLLFVLPFPKKTPSYSVHFGNGPFRHSVNRHEISWQGNKH
jgi:hypothetical protein